MPKPTIVKGKAIQGVQDPDIILELKQFLADRQEAEVLEPEAVADQDKPVAVTAPSKLIWQKVPSKARTTNARCIIIDRYNRWHEDALVNLHGIDTTGFTWKYYGTNYPILTEDSNGNLKPWYFKDAVGESSNRLHKAAKPEGFKNTFKHKSTRLQKIQIGLMVALVLGLFFLIFVMIQ